MKRARRRVGALQAVGVAAYCGYVASFFMPVTVVDEPVAGWQWALLAAVAPLALISAVAVAPTGIFVWPEIGISVGLTVHAAVLTMANGAALAIPFVLRSTGKRWNMIRRVLWLGLPAAVVCPLWAGVLPPDMGSIRLALGYTTVVTWGFYVWLTSLAMLTVVVELATRTAAVRPARP